MYFNKRKKGSTPVDIINFVDKVVKEYGRALETRPFGMYVKLSLLPYPIDIIKACIKIDLANNLSDKAYIGVLSGCYIYLADFVDDVILPKGPDLISLMAKNKDLDDSSMELLFKEILDNEVSVDRGIELHKKLGQIRKDLLLDIYTYLNAVETVVSKNPSAEAIKLLEEQITIVKNYIKVLKS